MAGRSPIFQGPGRIRRLGPEEKDHHGAAEGGGLQCLGFQECCLRIEGSASSFPPDQRKSPGRSGSCGAAHKKDQNALTLSSGETQRLGLARALVVEPEILYLDEPTASIDPQNTAVIEEIILNLKREARTLVIMATHDMEQVRRITDRVLRMEQGRIVG